MALPREFFSSFTATTTPQTFAFGFPARVISVVSDGTPDLHVSGDGDAATTADPIVQADETYNLPEPFRAHDRRQSVSIRSASATCAGRVYAYE